MTATVASNEAELAFRQQLGRLYQRNRQRLARVAAWVTGSPGDAEDVIHNVFVRLLDGPPPPGFDRNPQGYLRQAVIHEGIEAVRYRSRRAPLEVNMDGFLNFQPAAGCGGNDDTQQRLMDAISKLDPHVAALLALRYEVGLTCAEIGKVVGQSRARITMRLVRAQRRLKKLMSASAVPAQSVPNAAMPAPGETR